MGSVETSSNPGLPANVLAEVVQALRDIYSGASVTGRWYCEELRQAVGHDPDEPDEGYYDRSQPPPGYDAGGCLRREDDPTENLKSAEWEEYTLEEQSRWLRTCATVAKDTLEKLGVRVIDPGAMP